MGNALFVKDKIFELKKKFPKFVQMVKDKYSYQEIQDTIEDYNEHANKKIDFDIVDGHLLIMLREWEKHKVTFNFNKELYDELYNQALDYFETKKLDEQMPVLALKHLPYDTIAVNLPPFAIPNNSNSEALSEALIDGGFMAKITEEGIILRWLCKMHTKITYSDKSKVPSLIDRKDNIIGLLLPNDKPMSFGQMASNVFNTVYKMASNNYSVNFGDNKHLIDVNANTAATECTLLLMIALQIILYLNAKNADVSYREETKTKKHHNTVKHIIKEVGYHIGHMLKQRTKYINASTEHTGQTKRPHSRRGHWHSYWHGKRTGTERRLVLQWVAPTYIHASSDVPTIMNV